MPLKSLVELVERSTDAELAARWDSLTPLYRAALFKLMRRDRAFGFFKALPFEHQYQLILAAPLGSIAPLIEGAGAETVALFHSVTQAELEALLA